MAEGVGKAGKKSGERNQGGRIEVWSEKKVEKSEEKGENGAILGFFPDGWGVPKKEITSFLIKGTKTHTKFFFRKNA